MRWLAGALAALALGAAGSAHATAFVVDVSAPPTFYSDFGEAGMFGTANFAPIFLQKGDTLTVNVSYGQTVDLPFPGIFFQSLLSGGQPVSYDAPVPGDGFEHIEYPGASIFYTRQTVQPYVAASFTLTADIVGPAKDGVGYSLDGVSYFVTPVPEPATWTLMILGFGGLGVVMRRSVRMSAGLHA